MWWFVLAGLVAVACGCWAWIEARLFVVRRRQVPVLPPGSDAIRVLHLTDLHLVPRQRRKIRWVRGLARHHPDLVVVTGDNLGGVQAVPALLSALSLLLKLPGAFVNGSNDYFGPSRQSPFVYFRGPTSAHPRSKALPTGVMVQAFEDSGWLNLNNRRGVMEARGQVLSFIGVDDPHIGRDSMPHAGGERGIAHIGVAHAPYVRVLAAFCDDGVDLALAGHTHGGQVRIPGVGALVTNCDLDRRRARGLSGWPGPRPDAAGGGKSLWLHVSAGAGTSPFAPIRFACRPEATILELVPRREG
ncbi:MAG: metallophosphoesterase [Demequinaceae bacterium]|nr:metallophosphoesterase [Demequinaceae bacterium]